MSSDRNDLSHAPRARTAPASDGERLQPRMNILRRAANVGRTAAKVDGLRRRSAQPGASSRELRLLRQRQRLGKPPKRDGTLFQQPVEIDEKDASRPCSSAWP